MKKALSCILILSIVIGLCSLLFGCGYYFPDIQIFKEIQHYKDKNNFVTITATCVTAECYSKPSKTHYYAINFENPEYEMTEDCIFQFKCGVFCLQILPKCVILMIDLANQYAQDDSKIGRYNFLMRAAE